MFDLFKFVLLRPSKEIDGDTVINIDISETSLGGDLALALKAASPLKALQDVAKNFISSKPAFVKTIDNLELATGLQSFYTSIADKHTIPLRDLSGDISASFQQQSPAVVSQSGDFFSDKSRIFQSIVALRVLPDNSSLISQLARMACLLNIIERVAKKDETLASADGIQSALEATIQLPDNIFPLPSDKEINQPSPAGNTDAANNTDLKNNFNSLTEIYTALTNAQPSDISSTQLVDPKLPARNFNIKQPSGFLSFFSNNKLTALSQNAERIESRPIALSNTFSNKLSNNASALLARIADSPGGFELKKTHDQVVQNLRQLVPQAEKLKKQAFTSSPSVGFLAGNIVKPFSLNLVSTASSVAPAIDPPPDGPLMTALPNSHANYKPIGVGDLLVVKQQLLRYEAGEISNIQNILKGESLKRSVGRNETIETTVTTESETTKEEERDQQSTDRFELQSQTQNVIASDSTKTSGSTASDAYGSLVESMSSQNTTTNAVTHSQEVVNRAASKVTERTKKQVITHTMQQFTEKNTHGFNNAVAGAKNETGIYQWVDKIYQSQVYNYGKRLFYDLVIPEPADFYIQATAQKMITGLNASRPDPFELQYDGISEYNYAYYAGKYNVTAIEPPPQYIKTVSRTFSNKDLAKGALDMKAEVVPIPAGYAAYTATTAYAFISSWGPVFFEITVGTTYMQIVNFGVNSVGLNLETDTLPVIFAASSDVHAYTITMEITCTRTDDNYRKWQARMFAVILQAYQQKQALYQEQLANIVTILRTTQYGQSSIRNRLCERTELKKHCIAMFTQQEYDSFNAIDMSSQGYEQPDFAAADIQADYIRFFEQAIEWEQMTYYFYPYFWGRKNHWIDKMSIDDSDQQFADFLRAGAARALLPVRPGFERALIFFINSGTIPSKDDLDNITSPLYVPVLQEIKEVENGMSMEPVPVGEPWEVRLPTTLVLLRKDDKLPEWGEVDGKWVPLN